MIFADEHLKFLLQTFWVVFCYPFPAAVNKNEHRSISADLDFFAPAADGHCTHVAHGDQVTLAPSDAEQGHWPLSERQDRISVFITS